MGFETWWNKNSGRSIQPNSNLKTACRYAYNDALMENEEKIKELEDKLKIAVSAIKRIDNIAYYCDLVEINNIACDALEKIGELK